MPKSPSPRSIARCSRCSRRFRAALGLLLLLTACAGSNKSGGGAKPPPPELEAVHYASEASQPAFAGKPAVAQAAKELEGNPELHLLLLGRADSSGTADANMQLGLQRAHELRQRVLEQAAGKVDAKRVRVGSRGQAEPTGDNETEEGRAANRRVEFYFYYPDGTPLKSRFATPIVIEGE